MNCNRSGSVPMQGSNAPWSSSQHAQATLNSIGDAVITTDPACRITFLNAVAERLTGWSDTEALGHRIEEVFLPVDCLTRKPLRNSMELAMTTERTIILPPNCIIVRRDGSTCAIDDSAAPIWNVRQALASEQSVFRGVLTDTSDSRLPGLQLPSQPIKFSAFGHNRVTRAPRLGEHTDQALHELLGLAHDRIAELRAAGTFGAA